MSQIQQTGSGKFYLHKTSLLMNPIALVKGVRAQRQCPMFKMLQSILQLKLHFNLH